VVLVHKLHQYQVQLQHLMQVEGVAELEHQVVIDHNHQVLMVDQVELEVILPIHLLDQQHQVMELQVQ
jgi:hypothetical protein